MLLVVAISVTDVRFHMQCITLFIQTVADCMQKLKAGYGVQQNALKSPH